MNSKVAIGALFLFACCFSGPAEEMLQGLVLDKASVNQVLKLYSEMSGKEFIKSSAVKSFTGVITVSAKGKLRQSEALSLLESNLAAQAAIFINPVGSNRMSATLNDELLRQLKKPYSYSK